MTKLYRLRGNGVMAGAATCKALRYETNGFKDSNYNELVGFVIAMSDQGITVREAKSVVNPMEVGEYLVSGDIPNFWIR